jgi:hypothetical protein
MIIHKQVRRCLFQIIFSHFPTTLSTFLKITHYCHYNLPNPATRSLHRLAQDPARRPARRADVSRAQQNPARHRIPPPEASARSTGTRPAPGTGTRRAVVARHRIPSRRRDNSLADKEFDRCDEDEDYMPMPSSQPSTSQFGDEEGDMNAFRDNIANAIFANVN